jgi:RNA polymerase sigma factor (sigma-70 family)
VSGRTRADGFCAAEFSAIYRGQHALVRRIARRAGIAPAELDDAVQDVFVVVYRRWHELDNPQELKAWICKVAARTSHNYRRARRRYEKRFAEPAVSGEGLAVCERRSPEETCENSERLRWLTQALVQLDARLRQALVLTELERLSAREASELTGLSPNTLSSRLRAARQALRLAAREHAGAAEG